MVKNLRTVSVGDIYPMRFSWGDFCVAHFRGSWLELVLQMNHMSQNELRRLRKPCLMKSWVVAPVAGLLVRFGGGSWKDAPLNAFLQPDDARKFLNP